MSKLIPQYFATLKQVHRLWWIIKCHANGNFNIEAFYRKPIQLWMQKPSERINDVQFLWKRIKSSPAIQLQLGSGVEMQTQHSMRMLVSPQGEWIEKQSNAKCTEHCTELLYIWCIAALCWFALNCNTRINCIAKCPTENWLVTIEWYCGVWSWSNRPTWASSHRRSIHSILLEVGVRRLLCLLRYWCESLFLQLLLPELPT